MFNQVSSDKNLNARANSANPKTTLTEFNHPPDWGKDLYYRRKSSKKGNGSPSPTPNLTSPRNGDRPFI